MIFLFTLRAARLSCGYTAKDVGRLVGSSERQIIDIEQDSGTADFEIIEKLVGLYNVPIELIYLGPEIDCFKRNRNLCVTNESRNQVKRVNISNKSSVRKFHKPLKT